jgi:N-acetylglucosaminyldiphosphoundecaprenol N-acetyl-beta-D-mannosaminyltransferase
MSSAGPSRSSDLATVSLRGIALHAVSETQVIEHVTGAWREGAGGWIVTLNLQHLHRCEHDEAYRRLVQEADLLVADGAPLVWASRLQRTPLPQRVAGSDLIGSLSRAAASCGRSVFLLGGAAGAAEGAARALTDIDPGLHIAGTLVPHFEEAPDEATLEEIGGVLREAAPDLVFVALGSPKQERLIRALRTQLPAAWWIGVGISFSFLSGDVRRAPRWMRRLGLEWAHRLAQEPRRLGRRYLIEGIPFGIRLMIGSIMSRMSH